jgi:hypothetical protein
MKWNVVGVVVDVIEADTAEEAQAEMHRALSRAGFDWIIPGDWTDLHPFRAEDQS